MEHSPTIPHAKELLFLLGIILATGTLTGFIARLLKLAGCRFISARWHGTRQRWIASKLGLLED